MDVEIGEMENVIQVVDRQSFLDPKVLERLVAEVMARMKERQASDKGAERDCGYTQSIIGGH